MALKAYTASKEASVALTTERIDAEAFARWGEMKGAPLALCRGFARAIEAEARRAALTEAERICDHYATALDGGSPGRERRAVRSEMTSGHLACRWSTR